jgi:hypothetical protein
MPPAICPKSQLGSICFEVDPLQAEMNSGFLIAGFGRPAAEPAKDNPNRRFSVALSPATRLPRNTAMRSPGA